MSIFSRIKDWLTGGSKKSKTTTRRLSRANTVSYYGGGGASGGYRAYSEARRKELQRKKERQEQENTTKKLAAITDKASGDVVNTAKNPKVLKAIEKRAKATPPKPKAKVSDSPYATKNTGNSEFYSRNTAKKTSTKPNTDPFKGKATAVNAKANDPDNDRLYSERRDTYGVDSKKYKYGTSTWENGRLKYSDNEFNRMKYRMENHPKIESFMTGLGSGATFGVSDVAGAALNSKFVDKEQAKELNETYEKNKKTGYEITGMLMGSVPSFGGIAKPAQQLLGRGAAKVAPKLAANATEKVAAKVASGKFVQRAATKAATRAAERGLVEGVTKEVTDAFAKNIARRIVTGVEKDIAINMTGGLLMDTSYAIKESGNPFENPEEFAKNYARNRALSYTLGAGLTIAPELRVGRALPVRAANKFRHALTGKGYSTTLRPEFADVAKGIGKNGVGDSAEGIIKAALASDSDEAVEAVTKVEPPKPMGKSTMADVTAEGEAKTLAKQADKEVANQETDALVDSIVREEAEGARQVEPPKKVESPKKVKDPRTALAELRASIDNARKEQDEIVDEIIGEYGDINPDWSKLTAEEREALRAKKMRIQELQAEEKALIEELRKIPAPPPKAAEPDVATEIRNLSDEKIALQNNIEAKYGESAPSDINMTAPEKEVYETQMKRLEDVSSELEAKRESLRPKTVAEEAEEATAKAETTAVKTEPPTKAEAEPKVKPPKKEGEAKSVAVDADAAETESTKAWRENYRKVDELYDQYNASVRKATEGEVGARKGIKTVNKLSSDKYRKGMLETMSGELKELEKNSLSVFNSDYTYNVATDKARLELIEKRLPIVMDDVGGTVKRLETKLDPDELVSPKDLADAICLKSYFKEELGIEFPAELETLYNRVILKQQTQNAQGLRAGHLMLMEHDPDFRAMCIRKDFAKFRDAICGADNWKDIERSMDARNHKGYFKERLDEIIDLSGKAGKETEYEQKYLALQRDIFRNTKPSVWDVINFYRHSFMLMGLHTMANNILGNGIQGIMHSMADTLDVLAERGLERHYGKGNIRRTTEFLKTADERKLAGQLTTGFAGKVSGKISKGGYERFKDPKFAKFAEAFDKLVDTNVPRIMGDNKWGMRTEIGADYVPQNLREQVRKGFAKVGGGLNKAVGFGLNEPDNVFVERHFRTSLLKYLKANGIDSAEKLAENPALVRDAVEHAELIARENTYKQRNRIVEALERWRAKGYRKGKGWKGIGQKMVTLGLDARAPYLKVPVNMTANGLQYSPVGLLKDVGNAASAWRSIRQNGINEFNSAELVKAVHGMSKGLTGMGIMLMGFLACCDEAEQLEDDSWGFIARANKDLKEYGVRDSSFKWGNANYSLANMGMGAMQWNMGALLAEDMNERGGAPASLLNNIDLLTDAFSAVFDTIQDHTLVENGVNFIEEIAAEKNEDGKINLGRGIGNALTQTVFDYFGQLIPSPVRAIARGSTEGDLDTGVKGGEGTTPTSRNLHRGVNNLISNVPVLNEKKLPHKVDSHGNLVNARPTTGDKVGAVVRNYADPFKKRTINIPEADKFELKTKDEKGEGYKPRKFDENRTYQASIGKGQFKETIDLTGKEREQAARSVKKSGHEMGDAVVYAKRGWFGDSHGERAQQILAEIPEDEEEAREYLYSTPEVQNLNSEERREFMDTLYYGGKGHEHTRGRDRTSNHAVYVDIHGGDEGDFKFLNDLNKSKQEKYAEYNLEAAGVTKGEYADAVEAMEWASHKYKDGNNVDTITSKGAMVEGILSLGLEREKNIAIYNAMRGKRKWKDWDGVSSAGYGGYRRGRRGWRRYHRHGGSSKVGVNKTAPKVTGLKAGVALTPKSSRATSKRATSAQYTPQLQRVQAKIDLPYPKERRT